MKEVRRFVCVLHVWMQWLMNREGGPPPNDGAEVSKSAVDSHLRYILTAGVAVLFLLWVCDVREKSLGVSFFKLYKLPVPTTSFRLQIRCSTDFCWFDFDCSRDLRIIIRNCCVCWFLFSITIFNHSISI